MKRKEAKGMGVVILAIAIFVIGGPATEALAQDKNGDTGDELVTHTYIVPPNIHRELESRAEEMKEEREAFRRDREGIMERLARCGIDFPGDALVEYDPSSSALKVRNTKEEMAKLETLLDRLREDRNHGRVQIFVTVKEVRFNPKDFQDQFESKEDLGRLFSPPPPAPKSSLPEGSVGGKSIFSVQELWDEMSRPPKPPKPKPAYESKGFVSGVLSDPQFQMLIRALKQKKGVDLLSSPSFLLRSGQAGVSRVDAKRWGVVPEIGADDVTVDLALYLPKEEGMLYLPGSRERTPSAQVSIFDGHTAVFREQVSKDEVRVVFVTAKLVDPAGLEIRGKQPDSPEKSKAAPATAKVPDKKAAKPKAPSPPADADTERKLTEEEIQSVRAADKMALEGSRKLAADNYEGAIKDYEVAVKKLPDHPLVKERRNAYTAQLENSRRRLSMRNVAKQLEEIVVPSVDFRNTRLNDVLVFLQEASAELDQDSPGPDRGLRLVLAEEAKDQGKTSITLKLSNVPLIEVIRYTAELSNCRYEIEGRTVTLFPKKDDPGELYTNTYIVPPTFLISGAGEAQGDPFANPGAAALAPRKTAKEILEAYGVTFGNGTSATYNPASSTLIVRQTHDQMDLVEAVVDSLIPSPEKQILLDYRIIESRAPLFPETAEETAKTRGDPFDPDSGARVHGASANPWLTGLKLAISKVLTPPENVALLEQAEAEKKGKIRRAPQLVVRSGQRAEMWIGDAVTEIDPVLGPDDLSIDLNLSDTGKPANAGHQWTTQVTIWDGQTVAIEKKRGKKRYQTILLTATIIDPAGLPARKQEPPPVALPEKDKTKDPAWEPGSLFPKSNEEPQAMAPAFPEFVLKADEKLIIHEVRPGETLYQFARKHGPSVSRIKEVNRMRSDMMTVGDRVLIPVKIRDHFLERVKAGWELPAIAREVPDKAGSIILPAVEFRDTSLSDALEFFQSKSIELDRESPEAERGFDFILEDPDSVGGMKITLKLSNVPLFEAVGYTAKLANCDYEIEGRTVTVSPKSQAEKANDLPSPAVKPDAKIDPSDVWYSAFMLLQEGEAAEKSGDALKALSKYNQAAPLYDGLARQFPSFYPDLTTFRRENLKEKRVKLLRAMRQPSGGG